MTAILIKSSRISKLTAIATALVMGLSITALCQSSRLSKCTAAKKQQSNPIAVDAQVAVQFAQYFTERALDYRNSYNNCNAFIKMWAYDAVSRDLISDFDLRNHARAQSIDFVSSEYWKPVLLKDGTVEVNLTGTLIDSGKPKIRTLPLRITYVIARERTGYRVENYTLKYVSAKKLKQFLQNSTGQKPSSANEFALIHYKWAMHYRQLHRYDIAAESLTAAIAANENFAVAYRQRAFCKYKLNNTFPEADINQAIKLDPNDWPAYFDRAVYLDQYSREEFKDYSKVIKLCPLFPYSYSNRAWILSYLGLYKNAISDCQKAIDLEPDKSGGYSIKADIENQNNQLLPAILDCNRAIQLNSNDQLAYEVRASIREKVFDYPGASADRSRSKSLWFESKLINGL